MRSRDEAVLRSISQKSIKKVKNNNNDNKQPTKQTNKQRNITKTEKVHHEWFTWDWKDDVTFDILRYAGIYNSC